MTPMSDLKGIPVVAEVARARESTAGLTALPAFSRGCGSSITIASASVVFIIARKISGVLPPIQAPIKAQRRAVVQLLQLPVCDSQCPIAARGQPFIVRDHEQGLVSLVRQLQ